MRAQLSRIITTPYHNYHVHRATLNMRDDELFSITLGEDQILRVIYGYQRRVTLTLVKAATSQASQLVTVKHPLIVAGPHMIYLDYDAGKYIAGNKPAEIFSAVAVITKTRLEQTLGRMYLRIHKSKYPLRLFQSEAEAENWLQIYRPIAAVPSAPTPLIYL